LRIGAAGHRSLGSTPGAGAQKGAPSINADRRSSQFFQCRHTLLKMGAMQTPALVRAALGIAMALAVVWSCQSCEIPESEPASRRFEQEAPVDKRKLSQAPVVVQVKIIEEYGGSKYYWMKVQVTSVLKNKSSGSVPSEVQVGYIDWSDPIVRLTGTRCTMYLVPCKDGWNDRWMLLGHYLGRGTSHGDRVLPTGERK